MDVIGEVNATERCLLLTVLDNRGRPCHIGSQREASSDEQAEGVREKSKPAPLLGFQQEG